MWIQFISFASAEELVSQEEPIAHLHSCGHLSDPRWCKIKPAFNWGLVVGGSGVWANCTMIPPLKNHSSGDTQRWLHKARELLIEWASASDSHFSLTVRAAQISLHHDYKMNVYSSCHDLIPWAAESPEFSIFFHSWLHHFDLQWWVQGTFFFFSPLLL